MVLSFHFSIGAFSLYLFDLRVRWEYWHFGVLYGSLPGYHRFGIFSVGWNRKHPVEDCQPRSLAGITLLCVNLYNQAPPRGLFGPR